MYYEHYIVFTEKSGTFCITEAIQCLLKQVTLYTYQEHYSMFSEVNDTLYI